MNNIWFSSDFHINHKNIAGPKLSNWDNGYRAFDSVEDMNNTILKGINDNVNKDDVLYFLGDFCFGGHTNTPYWRSLINCKTIHWITGNHDLKAILYKNHFTSIQDYLKVVINKRTYIMFHYPILSWDEVGKGSVMLHGHVHCAPEINKLNSKCKRLDVGIDHMYYLTSKYRPFSLDEIDDMMDAKPILILDHHNSTILQ